MIHHILTSKILYLCQIISSSNWIGAACDPSSMQERQVSTGWFFQLIHLKVLWSKTVRVNFVPIRISDTDHNQDSSKQTTTICWSQLMSSSFACNLTWTPNLIALRHQTSTLSWNQTMTKRVTIHLARPTGLLLLDASSENEQENTFR